MPFESNPSSFHWNQFERVESKELAGKFMLKAPFPITHAVSFWKINTDLKFLVPKEPSEIQSFENSTSQESMYDFEDNFFDDDMCLDDLIKHDLEHFDHNCQPMFR